MYNALATYQASTGGTAFPICLYASDDETGNSKSSGKVCNLAHSRTLNLLHPVISFGSSGLNVR